MAVPFKHIVHSIKDGDVAYDSHGADVCECSRIGCVFSFLSSHIFKIFIPFVFFNKRLNRVTFAFFSKFYNLKFR